MARFRMDRIAISRIMKEFELSNYEDLAALYTLKTGFPISAHTIRGQLANFDCLSVPLSSRISHFYIIEKLKERLPDDILEQLYPQSAFSHILDGENHVH